MTVPYTFGNLTTAIPLSYLDSNFATPVTIGNTTVALGNTVTSIGNLGLANVTINSGNVTANVTYATANAVVYSNASNVGTTSANLTFNGTTLTIANDASINGLTVGLGGGSVSTNTVVGYLAGTSQTSSSVSNSFFGAYAGTAVTSGSNNTFLGRNAGNNVTTGGSNILIGEGATTSGATDTNELVIGVATGGLGSNTGRIVVYNGTYGNMYQGNNGASWAIYSDQRVKKNIVDNTVGLEVISQLRIRNFEYRLPEEVDPELGPDLAVDIKGTQLGVIAQEVQAVLPDCVTQEAKGFLSVNTDNIMWHMVNAIKELSAEVDSLKQQLSSK